GMKWLGVLASVTVVVSLVMPVGVAFGQPQPPGPVTVQEKRFPTTAPSGPYDALLLVLDMAPSTTFPAHSHGGPAVLTVMEGTFWERSQGHEMVMNVGDTLIEETGRV